MHRCENCRGQKMEQYTWTIKGWLCQSCINALTTIGLIRR